MSSKIKGSQLVKIVKALRSHRERADSYVPGLVSCCFFILLLFHMSCGAATSEVQYPETVSATAKESSEKTSSPTERKASFVIEYRKQTNETDLKKAFGSYMARDAVWVDKLQLFVNQEFDFAVAMSMPDIGAGIAAKKRQEANKNVGEQLALIPAANLQEIFITTLEKYPDIRQENLRASISLYGLLFGDKKARLLSVLEVMLNANGKAAMETAPIRFIYVSQQNALTGEGSWMSDNGATLISTMRIGTEELVSLFYRYRKSEGEISPEKSKSKPTAKCPVGGNQKLKGAIIGNGDGRTILRLDRQRPTIISCVGEPPIR